MLQDFYNSDSDNDDIAPKYKDYVGSLEDIEVPQHNKIIIYENKKKSASTLDPRLSKIFNKSHKKYKGSGDIESFGQITIEATPMDNETINDFLV